MTKKTTYAMEITGTDGTPEPLYTTDDTGRLFAAVFGVLLGSGVPGVAANTHASGILNSLVATGKEHTEALKGGRGMWVYVWKREGEPDD